VGETRQGHAAHGGRPLGDLVDRAIVTAVQAHAGGEPTTLVVTRLASTLSFPDWPTVVNKRLSEMLVHQLDQTLGQGWEPRDLPPFVRRRAGGASASLVEGLLGEAVQRHSAHPSEAHRWSAQVADLAGSDDRPFDGPGGDWYEQLGAGVGALAAVYHAPVLPRLGGATPKSPCPGPSVDPRLLDKVRALLAKAEATNFAEEAEAFLAKAQELMTRHNLDRAALEGASTLGVPSAAARRFWLDDPYMKQKSYLLGVVAGVNRCRPISSYELGMVTVFGHPDDLAVTEILFTALALHATRQMLLPLQQRGRDRGPERAGGQGGEDDLGALAAHRRASRPAYRRSFLLSYANRIGHRLREATAAATAAAVKSSSDALLPVLASRERDAEDALHQMFPSTRQTNFTASDGAGWAAGRAAADLADLTLHRRLA
jgi:hypothetical protein